MTDIFDTRRLRSAVLKARRGPASRRFPVAMARGKHLFPFRTEKLSLSAPMVLGSQGPGRVGRRRFSLKSRPLGRLFVVLPAWRGPPARAARLAKNRRRPTLPGPCGPSTIGAVGLNCSVRNGKRCFPRAIATGNRSRPGASADPQNCTTRQHRDIKISVKPSTH